MILQCYSLLKRMEPRPAMWTGETSLKSVLIYISGYYDALLDQKVVNKPQTSDPFFDWVADKLGYYESTAGLANMILAYSMGYNAQKIIWEDVFKTTFTEEQHSQSIKIFYKLVEEFKDEMENK